MTLVCGGAYSSNHHWHYAVYFLGFRMGGGRESAHGGQTNFCHHRDTTHTFTFMITDDDLIELFCTASAYI